MLNKKMILLLTLAAAVSLSGCGSKKDPETEAAPSQPSVAADTAETEEVSEAAEELAPITPSDYLIKNVSDYVTLCPLDDLSATQYLYTITDEMVQERIDEELYMYSEEVEVDKAAEGNTVYADVTSSVQGVENSESEESTYFTIGDEDYGPEFDAQLLGKAVGDKMSFSVTYGNDAWFEDWIGHTVDFDIEVTGVYETITPEYDDNFIKENTDYASKEEYEEGLRETMTEEYSQEGYLQTLDELLQYVVDESTFDGYPEDLYASCEADILSYYGQFLGTDDRDEIMDSIGLTDEDLDFEILDSVNRRLAICAICETQGLEVTEEEYVAEVTQAAEEYGYLSAADYEETNTREAIVWSLYQGKATEFLYDSAEITPVETSGEDLYADDIFEIETEEETFGAEEFYAAELDSEE